MTTNLDLARIVATKVQLRSVALQAATVNAAVDQLSPPPSLAPAQAHRARYRRSGDGGERLQVAMDFEFRAVANGESDPTEADAVNLTATYLLEYSLPPDLELPEPALEQFAWLNGAYNAWPYWRELVQTVTGRVGLVAITVPVYRPKIREVDLGNGLETVSEPKRPQVRSGIMGKNEKSSPATAKVAAKVLASGKATPKQAMTLAGSVLTQSPDRKKSSAPKGKKR